MLDWNGSVNGHLHRRSGDWNVREVCVAERFNQYNGNTKVSFHRRSGDWNVRETVLNICM